MDVIGNPLSVFPHARVKAGSAIHLGRPGHRVLPTGVWPPENLADDWSRLDAGLSELYEHLRLTATNGDETAASHLVEHVRRYGSPDLCRHGLPLFHRGEHLPFSCEYGDVTVPAVRRMIDALDATAEMHSWLASQRSPVRASLVNAALAWPIHDSGYASVVLAETERGGTLRVERARQLVTLFFDEAMRQAAVSLSISWRVRHKPDLAFATHTTVGLYVVEALRRLGVADDDLTYVCSHCHLPYIPARRLRRGQASYCQQPECQRARARLKQAQYRARKGETQ